MMSRDSKIPALLPLAVVFLASASLFILELATAKALLPRFGGSPMVWTTSMLAYQILLLAGYAHAHGIARLRSGTVQAFAHALLLLAAVALVWLRVSPSLFLAGDPAAASRHPLGDLLGTLFGTIALPFVAISCTSPLVQHWWQRLAPGRPAYWLYAVSNVGSFVGLLAYPFLLEPWLDLPSVFLLWRILVSLAFLGMAGLGWAVSRSAPALPAARIEVPAPARGRGVLALWFFLPATTSALLLSATNELCHDLAVFPFLWVLPLSFYLLSFSLTFRERAMASPNPWAALLTLVTLSTTAASLLLPAMVHIVLISALVLVLCLAAHRELFRLRPPAGRETGFYLCIAAGSGLGAVAVAVGAPALFTGFWEFQIAILLLWGGLVVADLLNPQGVLRHGDRRHARMFFFVAVWFFLQRFPDAGWKVLLPGGLYRHVLVLGFFVSIALATLLWRVVPWLRNTANSVLWPRLLVGLVLFYAETAMLREILAIRNEGSIVARNFFGMVRVHDILFADKGVQTRNLLHGRINHGWQYQNADLHARPTAYHSPSTGIGQIILLQQQRMASVHIGVTGLGAGALAAYPRATDRMVLYEIDPQVVDWAVGPGAYFSFVNESPGEMEVVLGDARQSMRVEWDQSGSRAYDLLALDAFSSDAIPMHLLTREAFALYLDHLHPDGVVAVNISNRFLDLRPVMADIREAFSLHGLLIDSMGDEPLPTRSLWVLFARNPASLAGLGGMALGTETLRWTDAHASPMSLMKWWGPRRFERKANAPPGETFSGPGP